MLKVLSTKLTEDEWELFTTIAKQRGESKSGLLKRLAVDYMNDIRKVDGVESTGNPHPTIYSKQDLVTEENTVITRPPACSKC